MCRLHNIHARWRFFHISTAVKQQLSANFGDDGIMRDYFQLHGIPISSTLTLVISDFGDTRRMLLTVGGFRILANVKASIT